MCYTFGMLSVSNVAFGAARRYHLVGLVCFFYYSEWYIMAMGKDIDMIYGMLHH